MMRSIFNPGWAKISLNASSPALAAETSANRLPARTVIDKPLQRTKDQHHDGATKPTDIGAKSTLR
jgi:hypothetical protein